MRKRLLTIIRTAIVLALVTAAVIVVNDRNRVSRQLTVDSVARLEIEPENSLRRFQSAIQLKTISTTNPARTDAEPFDAFSQWVADTFPQCHQPPVIRWTGADFGDPDNRTLLYTWHGSNESLDPILLMAHYDVVPVEPETRGEWTHPPFSAEVDQDFIWGRGTLDAKNSVVAMFEAVTRLIDENFEPHRTIYLSLGHDEEVGGSRGNKVVAEWMRSKGIRLEFVLDEGGCIFRDFPGMDKAVALIGIAEKGFANIKLTATLPEGGHASMPPQQTTIEILSAAIDRLNRNPMPRHLTDASERMLDYLGPEMRPPTRLAISNRWLFGPLIKRQLGSTESGNAMLRTTFAPTMLRAGVKDNVLPSRAHATINVRLLPGDTVSDVLDHMKYVIDDDRVAIEVGDSARQASGTSSTESAAFEAIHRTVKQIYPETIVAPFILVGGTDSSHFQDIATDIYRFIPTRLDADDLKRIHGVDERIATEDYFDLIRFYVQFIKSSATASE